jgi:hypothetical protein
MVAIRYVLAGLLGLALPALACAGEVRGFIVRVDPDNKEVLVEARGPSRGMAMTLQVDDKTQVLVGGAPAALADLAEGRRARIVYEERDGKRVARVIRQLGIGLRGALPAPAPAPAPSPAPAPARKGANTLTGTLQRVALTDREIVLLGPGPKGADSETTIAVPEGTPITKDGKTVGLDSLREGEKVTVETENRKDRLTAVSVTSGRPAASARRERRNLIPLLRLGLKMADQVLQGMDQQRREP